MFQDIFLWAGVKAHLSTGVDENMDLSSLKVNPGSVRFKCELILIEGRKKIKPDKGLMISVRSEVYLCTCVCGRLFTA